MDLRVIDAGTVSAIRSQTLWHGIASAMREDAAPVLSLCRPASPYVCLGYHRRLDELDEAACRREGLPILRRQIGGGPVYLDGDQLFFQITLPRRRAPAFVQEIYARLLGPAVDAFRALGLRASLRGMNDIAVDGRKLSGTGAGQIGEAATVVGNLLFRFPHPRMAAILSFASEALREECLRLMRRHVTSVESEGLGGVTVEKATRALIESYARALGLRPVPGALTDAEQAAIGRWDARFGDPQWIAGPATAARSGAAVKVCAGVFVLAAAGEGVRIEASVVDGRIERARLDAAQFNGTARRIEQSLAGQRMSALDACLLPFGREGQQVLDALREAMQAPGAARELGGDG